MGVNSAGGAKRGRCVWAATTSALALTIGGAVIPQAAMAQAAPAGQIEFDIPAQDLNRALLAFTDRAGLQIFYDMDKVAGKRSSVVRGSYAPIEALSQLLVGTGLTFRVTGNRVTLEPAPQSADGAIQLGPVRVEGEGGGRFASGGETAIGPVRGYVARRSASATKTDTPLIETPQSISVVTADQVAAQKPRTVAEALRYTPGLRVEENGVQTVTDTFSVRGFSQLAGSLFQDGMRRAGGSFFGYDPVEPYGLERIEVLRGPASVLYGQNSPGGIINLVTKRPTAEPVREIILQAGNFDRFQGAFDLAGPVDGEGRFRARLTALARDSDTQVDYVRDNRLFVAGGVSWHPSERTALVLLADYLRHNGQFIAPVPAEGAVLPNPNGHTPIRFFVGEPAYDRQINERLSLGYRFEHRFDGNWSVRQNFQYGDFNVKRHNMTTTGLQADERTLNRRAHTNFFKAAAYTIDSQLEGNFSTGALSHQFLIGGDYQHLTNDRVAGRNGVAPTLDLFAPAYGQPVALPAINTDTLQHQKQFGLYMQDTIRVGPISLMLSGRHDWADADNLNRRTGGRTETKDKAFTGRAGLVYQFASGIAPYFSYAESFAPVAGTDVAGVPFDPETGRQFEAGIRYAPDDRNIMLSASVFDLRRQNVTTADPANPGFSIQVGEVRSRGFELEARAALSEALTLIAAYTYTDIEVTRSNDPDLGKTLPYAPAHMASAWADWRPQTGALAGFRLGGGVRYTGRTAGNQLNTFFVPGFTIVDAMVGFDFGHLASTFTGLNFEINAANLFDKRYVAGCYDQCQFGARRTLLGTLRYSW